MGDPQAPFPTVLAVLDRHGLLRHDGRLRDDVQLVSMGDHFDWGAPSDRARATTDALALLAWLVSHPPEQVVLLAGNHDLARVCELASFENDEAFEAAWAWANRIYRGAPDEAGTRAFLERYPFVPDAEAVARDFSCFSVEQRRAVDALLRTGRLRLAWADGDLLLVHAGVTTDDFAQLGAVPSSASEAAARLNDFFDARIAQWNAGPLRLEPLHVPGSRDGGIARGILFQRPAFPVAGDPQFEGPPRRRFDPRLLPRTFAQAIGHVRDGKARTLLGEWGDGMPAADGPLRSLQIDDGGPRYQRGIAANAQLIFLDGGMNHTPVERYELLDLGRRAPLQPMPNVASNGT